MRSMGEGGLPPGGCVCVGSCATGGEATGVVAVDWPWDSRRWRRSAMVSMVLRYCSCMASNCLRICSISRRIASVSCALAGTAGASKPATRATAMSRRMTFPPRVTRMSGHERRNLRVGDDDYVMSGGGLDEGRSARRREARKRRGDAAGPGDNRAEAYQDDPGRRGRGGQSTGGMDGGEDGQRTLGIVETEPTILVGVDGLAALHAQGERYQGEHQEYGCPGRRPLRENED